MCAAANTVALALAMRLLYSSCIPAEDPLKLVKCRHAGRGPLFADSSKILVNR